jgi:hypothetical protein
MAALPREEASMTAPTPARAIYPRDRLGSTMRPALLVFVLSVLLLEIPGARERIVAPYSGLETRNLTVENVNADGPNTGTNVQSGDELVAVNGERIRNHAHYQYLVASNHAFTAQEYELRRNGVVMHATVRYSRVPRSLLVERAGLLLLALAFLTVGLWVYLRRPDTLGALFAANTSIFAYFLTDRPASASAFLQLAGEISGDAFVLVDAGCDVIACHLDAPRVVIETAEGRGVKTCGHAFDQAKLAPKGYITGADYNWTDMFENFVETLQRGGTLPNFVTGGYDKDYVGSSPFGAGATPAAINAANTAMQAMKNGDAIFVGPLMDNTGKLMVPAGTTYGPYADKLQQTDYLIQGVVGSIT